MMRFRFVGKLLLLSISVASLAQLALNELEISRRNIFTQNLCEAAGMYLQTGSLRSAYDVLNLGLSKEYPNACVSLIDQGRSYSPPCQKTNTYQTTTCTSEANTGVRAEIMFPTEGFLNARLLGLVIAIGALLSALVLAAKTLSQSLLTAISSHFGIRPGREDRIINSILKLLGISQIIREHSAKLATKIRVRENELSRQKLLRSLEAKQGEIAREYVSKALQIRHDMASPLAGLMTIKTRVVDEEALKILNESVRRLKRMMDDLSEIKEQTSDLRPEILELLVNDALATVSDANGIKPIIHFSEETSTIANVDGIQFKRIISNLIQNSVEANATEISIDLISQEKVCALTVSDNGNGIATDIKGQLFQKGATFGKANGTGLGLYSARETLRNWHGDLRVLDFDNGASFQMLIPVHAN